MTTSYWRRPRSFQSPDISTDVLIIGGGYVGMSVAYWLTEFRPDLKVIVLDRSECGAGASGRNAGFLTVGSASFYKGLSERWGVAKARDIHQFAGKSLELVWENLIKHDPLMESEKTTSLTLFQRQNQLQNWQENGFVPEDFNFKWIDQSELPVILQSRFYGAYETGPEYKVNPLELLASLRRILENRKVKIIENSSAFEVNENGVQTETNTIKAKQVVLAMNGYFPEFHQTFKDEIVPRRAQMLAVRTDENLQCPHLYYDPPERVYWRKTEDNILIIGGKRLLDEIGEKGNFEKNSPLIQRGLENYLKEQLGIKYKVINRWSGIMGFTEHELPLVGKIKAPIETYMIGGFSGHGMGLGFHSAMDVAELIIGMKKTSFFSQFKKGEFTL